MPDPSILYSKGFPTNRIPVKLPSTGQAIVLRETTVLELKSIAKTIIDNLNRRQMDVIYDATTEYLQKMVLTDGVDFSRLTEFDRLYCLMVFFQMSFYKEAVQVKCPHCGTDINYRYDMFKYIVKMQTAYVESQTVEITYKSRTYRFQIGWPTTRTMSSLMLHFYGGDDPVTEDMERTQFGIEFVLAFVHSIDVVGVMNPEQDSTSVDLTILEDFQDRLDCLNSIPSMVMFDEEMGLFNKITGYFINRLENCFSVEQCPQCHKDTEYGLPQSSVFYSLFYGSLRSLYTFVLQVESLFVWRYGCGLYDKEQYMTYNDLTTLIHQLQATEEKDAKERQKIGRDNLSKGLWYIREILNTLIFPEDRKHGNH